jgi:hypothetical protein
MPSGAVPVVGCADVAAEGGMELARRGRSEFERQEEEDRLMALRLQVSPGAHAGWLYVWAHAMTEREHSGPRSSSGLLAAVLTFSHRRSSV